MAGKGSFGEIFLASDDITAPVTSENAKFVVKIEPHKSGPLFVEIHCLIKAGKPTGKFVGPTLGQKNHKKYNKSICDRTMQSILCE